MILWSIERQEGSLGVYMPNSDVTIKLSDTGISCSAVRGILTRCFNNRPIEFNLVTPGGRLSTRHRLQAPDFLMWSWIPIFSRRAVDLMFALGSRKADFMACEFVHTTSKTACMHLPILSFDIVDLQRSQFSMIIPTSPPLPIGIRKLAIRNTSDEEQAGHCFRLEVPGHSQSFSEIVVSSRFASEWKAACFTGAEFRKLT